MSIAEKLTTIAENVQKVYEAGQQAGSGFDYDEVYNEGYADGVASVPNVIEYARQFYGTFFNANFPENYELSINIPNVTRMDSCFQQATGIIKLIVKGNNENNIINVAGAFRINTLEVLDLTDFDATFGDCNLCFYNNSNMREIKGTINLANAINTARMFDDCPLLEEVRFSENSIKLATTFVKSSNLSADTIQSIIDGLATVTTAETLTLNSNIVLTDEQKSTIETKGWTLVQ